MEFDIEKSMENYYRNIIADQIDDCLYTSRSEDEEDRRQAYWFNNGIRIAAMIARYGWVEVEDNE